MRRLSDVEAFFATSFRRAVANRALGRDTVIAATALVLLGVVFALRVIAELDPNAKRLRGLADHTIASYSKPQEPKRKRSNR